MKLKYGSFGALGRLAQFAVVSAMLCAAPAAAQEPVKVGMLMTHVGATGLFAREQARAAEMYVEQVNKAGGINGRPIQLVSYDTEGKPDRAGSLYRRLAEEDRVTAVIGPDSVLVALGMQSVPSEVKVMSVAGPGLYELIKPEFRDYMVSAWSAYSFAGSLALAYHVDKFSAKRVGMITSADAVGQRIANTAQKIGEKIGVQVIVESQPASDRDLLPSLRKLASANPPIDALYVYGSGPFANIAMNQMELAGLDVPIFYTGGNVIPALIQELSPEAAEKVFFTAARGAVADTLPDNDPYATKIRSFHADFAARFGEAATFPATVGYDMAHTVVDAIRTVGTDRAAVAEFIRNKQRFTGVQGVEFDRTNANGYGVSPDELIIATIKNGKFVFAGYLKDSLAKAGLTDEIVRQFMRDEKILLD